MSRRSALIAALLLAGFLLGGLAGWFERPAQWQAGLLETARVSADAATYGHFYESRAERVLLYFVYGGVLGTAIAGLLIAVVRKLLRARLSTAP